MLENIPKTLENLRKKRPLVQNITNLVVMNVTANALLAIGASPVMAHAEEELEDMLKIADALVINIGTLDRSWIASMEKAVKIATEFGKPIVLDPVGAGATKLRTQVALKLLEAGKISVLRGNLGEIAALLGEEGKTRGVDTSEYKEETAQVIAIKATKRFNLVVAVTGATDYVSDGKELYAIKNGVSLLGKVTGTGCMATSLIGAFCAVTEPLTATVSALTVFGVAAEKAYEEALYPGSFHVRLYDWLYRLNPDLLKEKMEVKALVF
ncbi:Hydroxyethylthiazole kinase [Thermodesulfatator indicus DSM 15286]|uniref:Hydroxyethylthiazole kinase n=1 Tax=Thermodesulfatator indicus (strain DSM 15286 / JCM 11887 / CIR29812) TaxID=667014 RepID=F8AD01_THEID|nr:hydroxyethylthiazole kinase [Thermodesulfatator indicus]AEH45867.1 Hydroxyethylthiazole kinase [Thermodesulfatator indicus DSM 15286]